MGEFDELMRLAEPPELPVPGCVECVERLADGYRVPCEECWTKMRARAGDKVPKLVAEITSLRSEVARLRAAVEAADVLSSAERCYVDDADELREAREEYASARSALDVKGGDE